MRYVKTVEGVIYIEYADSIEIIFDPNEEIKEQTND